LVKIIILSLFLIVNTVPDNIKAAKGSTKTPTFPLRTPLNLPYTLLNELFPLKRDPKYQTK